MSEVFGILAGIVFVVLVAKMGWDAWKKDQATKPRLPESPVQLAEYKNIDAANADIRKRVAAGWTVKSIDTSDGHINVGRTATATILTGGLALFLGGSRSSGKVTVLYEKTKS